MENKEATAKKLPERTKTFKILDRSYEVAYPNTKGLWDIEILKVKLSDNQYAGLRDNGTVMSTYAKYLIDMAAVINILIPEIKKDLVVKTIGELKPEDSKKLLSVYIKQILPWLEEWNEILQADDIDEPIVG